MTSNESMIRKVPINYKGVAVKAICPYCEKFDKFTIEKNEFVLGCVTRVCIHCMYTFKVPWYYDCSACVERRHCLGHPKTKFRVDSL